MEKGHFATTAVVIAAAGTKYLLSWNKTFLFAGWWGLEEEWNEKKKGGSQWLRKGKSA